MRKVMLCILILVAQFDLSFSQDSEIMCDEVYLVSEDSYLLIEDISIGGQIFILTSSPSNDSDDCFSWITYEQGTDGMFSTYIGNSSGINHVSMARYPISLSPGTNFSYSCKEGVPNLRISKVPLKQNSK